LKKGRGRRNKEEKGNEEKGNEKEDETGGGAKGSEQINKYLH